MKKIDLHIHTVPSPGKDAHFEFDLTKFEEYVSETALDCVAITNHNLFDLDQFREIAARLDKTLVLPGIEIDFEKGHLLLLSNNDNLEDFNHRCQEVSTSVIADGFLTLDKLKALFGDLGRYLLVPHFDKSPRVPEPILQLLGHDSFTGEVCSPKKFQRLKKQSRQITPLLFSDARIDKNLNVSQYSACHTFVRTSANELTFQSLVAALQDKTKVFLNVDGFDQYFRVLDNVPPLSFGLNVVLGNRSSGKSHFLSQVASVFNRDGTQVKHLKQFELVSRDERHFAKDLEKERGAISEKYLQTFADVVDEVVKIDRSKTLYELGEYLDSLLEFADAENVQDEYSKCALFREMPFPTRSDAELRGLLKALVALINSQGYKGVIGRHITRDNLENLLKELKQVFENESKLRLQKDWVNTLVSEISGKLHSSSASPHIRCNHIDFYNVSLEREQIRKFNAICRGLQQERSICREAIGSKFKIEATVVPISGADDIRELSNIRSGNFRELYPLYPSPYKYLRGLLSLSMDKGALYKMFCKVRYQVLNEYDKPVSGGERSEYNLLRSIEDSRQFDILLIDEPESSFDNVFLKEQVNNMIKDLSNDMPVIVVTHNSTVGMLLKPDRILYAQREIAGGIDSYHLYACSPGETEFRTFDEKRAITSHKILMDSLEAGEIAYGERRKLYEAFKARS
jgi:ABC-type hemin transport system ATPase subunit